MLGYLKSVNRTHDVYLYLSLIQHIYNIVIDQLTLIFQFLICHSKYIKKCTMKLL